MGNKKSGRLTARQFEAALEHMRASPEFYRMRGATPKLARAMLVDGTSKATLADRYGTARSSLYRIEGRFLGVHRELTGTQKPQAISVTVRVPRGTKARVEAFARGLWESFRRR